MLLINFMKKLKKYTLTLDLSKIKNNVVLSPEMALNRARIDSDIGVEARIDHAFE